VGELGSKLKGERQVGKIVGKRPTVKDAEKEQKIPNQPKIDLFSA
jgi:hypothetical protein